MLNKGSYPLHAILHALVGFAAMERHRVVDSKGFCLPLARTQKRAVTCHLQSSLGHLVL
jgi:hypothetical protein